MSHHRITLCLALLASTAAAAHANGVAEVYVHQNVIVPPVIEVSADMTGYKTATTSSLSYQLTIGGHCAPHFELYTTRLDILRHSTGEKWFANWEVFGVIDAIFERYFDRSRNLTAEEKHDAVVACNQFLHLQTVAGHSKASILSSDHQIDGPALFAATHELTCKRGLNHDSKTASVELINPVLCKRAPVVTPGSLTAPPQPPVPPGSHDLAQAFGVTGAEVEVDPDHASVVSRADLEVNAEIAVNGPGTVRFRLVHNGTPSDVGTLVFSKAGTRQLTYPLVVRCDQPPASGGGGGGFSSGPSNVHNGTVRVEILEPAAGVRHSEEAPYSVVCRETGTVTTPLPDLTIVDVTAGNAKAVVRIRNRGAAGAPATLLRATRTGFPAQQAAVPALGAGEQVEVDIELPGGNRRGRVTFTVDPAHAVQESDESNNETIQ